MTDKEQIIIDGVDVSECIFLDIVNERLWCDNVNISAIGKSQCPYVDCFKNPDCYFKQLARKTQEYTELKEDYEELEQRHNEAFQDFERLKQECEELKEKYKWYDHYKDSALLNKKLCDKASDERARYRKALEEIEKICKFNLYQSIVRQSVDSSMSCLNKIRDIISKAKGEGKCKID